MKYILAEIIYYLLGGSIIFVVILGTFAHYSDKEEMEFKCAGVGIYLSILFLMAMCCQKPR